MGLQVTKDRLNDKTISDRWIKLFIKHCLCCQVMSRAYLAIRTHPFTCAAYYPFEVIDHQYALVIIDAFSRWVELYPTKGVTADETANTGKRQLQTFVTFPQKPQPRKNPAVGFCEVLCLYKTSKAVL